MFRTIEYIIVAFLAGIFLGLLVGVSIRYPVNLDNIQKYQVVCDNEKITDAKVGVRGDVYYITCANGIEVKVH